MLDWTDRHCRYFLRLISRHTLLYTEMIVAQALLYGARERLLAYDAAEHPLAIQLAGSDPELLARAAAIAADWGYDEINLNVGCPSDRVQQGQFGACLMAEPRLVADCVQAMRASVTVPVTVKHRIGIDARDSYGELVDFVGHLIEAGCDAVIVHARKAWLQGLNPKENRSVPPLRYDLVLALKRDFPGLPIVINGGVQSLEQARFFLQDLDGVMIGRAVYHQPWLLAEADRLIFGDDHPLPGRCAVLERLIPYVERHSAQGVPLHAITRHLLGLFHGQPGARAWRRLLSTEAQRPGAGLEVLSAWLSSQGCAGSRSA
ncbi:tRNA dihydrouridine(20/20a) synthase DusA [Caldichromatium japonicum]|nr:tRNA dihydrouridine(20/20a) synthase DusA [Caldichromatium japonicum]